MNTRNLLTLDAILVALVALTALLSPATFLQANGLEVTQHTINLERAFGAVITGFAVTSWLVRNEPASKMKRAYFIGRGSSYLFFALVNVINITALSNLETKIGWGFFALNLMLGFAFLYFASKDASFSKNNAA